MAAGDPYFANVKLLMGFNGANGSTGAPGMSDESPAAHGTASTTVGAQITTAQSVYGGSSLSVATSRIFFADHADWNLSNGLFTLEFRIYPLAVTGTQMLIGQWNTAPTLGWVLNMNGTGLQLNISTTGSDNLADLVSSGITLAINTWYAICVDFDGAKYRLYVDGVMRGSSTTLRTINDSSDTLSIGASGGLAFPFNGDIDELRLTRGTVRYASDSGYAVPGVAFPRSGPTASPPGSTGYGGYAGPGKGKSSANKSSASKAASKASEQHINQFKEYLQRRQARSLRRKRQQQEEV